ncbi:hypothetical protein L1D14_23040 [Vibrio tubiashii]|uniref:DUF6884 domain-containing protein n=1 Tax=Vibrio tubiashii TaxID=29498 RepID=UPI001EFCC147|nr:DUF6884 domain-containing protein [Vibrio tubiashii]MCG9579081.1 hypothetical protein [Vibrio tubiashii]
MNKPTLIVSCSASKLEQPSKAIDLYTGGMFSMLRKHFDEPELHCNVLILSAEHGLVESSEVLHPYDTRLCSRKDKQGIANYVQRHKGEANKLLKKFAHPDSDLYVILSNDYLEAFDQIVGPSKKSISNFRSSYVSRGHSGIGELRGRLARVIGLIKSPRKMKPTYFKSGVANMAELGYLASGYAIGTSLAHVNTKKQTTLLAAILDGAKQGQKIFIDNGLITLMRQGKPIDPEWVFDQYQKIVDSLQPRDAKNISIVVPDDVCPEEALKKVEAHSKQILALSKKVDVILPIHRASCIASHALALMKSLKFSRNIRLGIPCLKDKEKDLTLPLHDIDTLLSLKSPKHSGEMLFRKVHMLGMSEATPKAKLQPRLKLAELYNVTLSLDACRTKAVFGKTTNGGLRKGSAIEAQLEEDHVKAQVVSHSKFLEHNFEVESYGSEPFVSQDLYEMINEEEIFDFIVLYNQLLQSYPQAQLPTFEKGEEQEAIEMAWNHLSIGTVERQLFEALKNANWAKFKGLITNIRAMKPQEKRFQAIKSLFEQTPTPMQMQLKLSA